MKRLSCLSLKMAGNIYIYETKKYINYQNNKPESRLELKLEETIKNKNK